MMTPAVDDLTEDDKAEQVAFVFRRGQVTAADVDDRSPAWLLDLAVDDLPERVARHPNTCGATLLRFLAAGDALWVRERRALWVAENPSVSADLLLWLADTYPVTAGLVVRHPRFPPEALALFARSDKVLLARAAAASPNVSVDDLVVLARHPRTDVRRAVAACRSNPDNLFELLAHDPTVEVRETVLRNPSRPPAVRTALAAEFPPGEHLEEGGPPEWREVHTAWCFPPPRTEPFPTESAEFTVYSHTYGEHAFCGDFVSLPAALDCWSQHPGSGISANGAVLIPVLVTATCTGTTDDGPVDVPAGVYIIECGTEDGEIGILIPDNSPEQVTCSDTMKSTDRFVMVTVNDCGDLCVVCDGSGSIAIGNDPEYGVEHDTCPFCDGAGFTLIPEMVAAVTAGSGFCPDGYTITTGTETVDLSDPDGQVILSVPASDRHAQRTAVVRAHADQWFRQRQQLP